MSRRWCLTRLTTVRHIAMCRSTRSPFLMLYVPGSCWRDLAFQLNKGKWWWPKLGPTWRRPTLRRPSTFCMVKTIEEEQALEIPPKEKGKDPSLGIHVGTRPTTSARLTRSMRLRMTPPTTRMPRPSTRRMTTFLTMTRTLRVRTLLSTTRWVPTQLPLMMGMMATMSILKEKTLRLKRPMQAISMQGGGLQRSRATEDFGQWLLCRQMQLHLRRVRGLSHQVRAPAEKVLQSLAKAMEERTAMPIDHRPRREMPNPEARQLPEPLPPYVSSATSQDTPQSTVPRTATTAQTHQPNDHVPATASTWPENNNTQADQPYQLHHQPVTLPPRMEEPAAW